MAHEKQILPNKTYQYIGIVTLSNDEAFKEFRERLKKRSHEIFAHRENTLFFLEVKIPETDTVDYYSFDYFQNVESFDQLRKLNAKDIEKISAQQKNTQITLTEQERELSNLANIYGYPHNYRSKMYLGRNYGWTTGAVVGIALGIVILILVLPIIFVPVMDVLVNLLILGVLIFIGLCLLEIVVAQVISAGLGAVIGASIGAFVHYCEKTFAQHKMQNQQEDQTTKINIMDAADEPRHVGDMDAVNKSRQRQVGSTENFEPQNLASSSISSSLPTCRGSSAASIPGGNFSPTLFPPALDDQLSCTTFCEVLFEDTPFASTPK